VSPNEPFKIGIIPPINPSTIGKRGEQHKNGVIILTKIPPAAVPVCVLLLLLNKKIIKGIRIPIKSAKINAKIIIRTVKNLKDINPILPPVYDDGRVIRYKSKKKIKLIILIILYFFSSKTKDIDVLIFCILHPIF